MGRWYPYFTLDDEEELLPLGLLEEEEEEEEEPEVLPPPTPLLSCPLDAAPSISRFPMAL